MFSTILEKGFMENLKSQALVKIKEERNRYAEIIKIIEDYSKENELIISNVYVLINNPDHPNNIYDKVYNIYTNNPFLHSNNLINKMHQSLTTDEKKFLKLKTIKEQAEFSIEYDMRTILNLFKVQKFKAIESVEILKPVKINGLFYMPPEIETIDNYHILYDCSKFDKHKDALILEPILYEQIITRKNKGIIGNAECVPCKQKQKDLVELIKVSIVIDWIPSQQNIALIGIWAYKWLNEKSIDIDKEKIQIISSLTPEELLEQLRIYSKAFSKFEITIKEQELHIPKDFRTRRFTYYMSVITEKGTIDKPFLDLFNCANFELIPCVKINSFGKDILIGSKYVLLRFFMIDLWILRLIKNMGLITNEILRIKMDRIINIVEDIRGKTGDRLQQNEYYFIGIFRDYNIDKKKANLSGKKFYPYYPHIFVKDNGKYRTIENKYE
jgi:hypothetical protein